MRGNRIVVAALFVLTAGSGRADPWRVGAGHDAEADRRGVAPLRFALELDGVPVGWVLSAEGGSPSAEVILEPPGAGGISKKHSGQPSYEPIQLRVGADMAPEVYAWIGQMLSGNSARRDGVLVAVDPRGNVRSRMTFFGGLVTEVGFPSLDGASREPAFLTVVIAPEVTRLERNATGRYAGAPVGRGGRRWLARDFTLEVSGLDASRVSRIESLRFKRPTVNIGDPRDPWQPRPLTVPDLVLTIQGGHADDWYAAFEDFVIRGLSSDDQERTGTLTFLDAGLAPLFRLDLDHLGFAALRTLPGRGDAAARDEVELYLERATFTRLY